VIVTAVRGIHGAPISELAFLQMLAFSRDFRRIERQREAKTWDRFPGTLLDGKTVGILGIGAIAEDLGPRCKAFGMRVVGISRAVRPVAGFDKIYSRAEIAAAAAELDYFVLLLPLEPDTRNIVDDRVLAAIKPGAYLINLARGGVLDEAALTRALNDKRLAGAALDALATEPLPATSPLWTMPNVIITPHIGGYYDDYPRDAARQFEQSLAHFVAGRPELMLHWEQRG
jgi:D-2-hydroxyacid dehydrogenase (NADP+)